MFPALLIAGTHSGCGKTTTGRCILRAYTPTAGEILYRQGDGKIVDLAQFNDTQLKPLRREIRMIFQDPYASLNPRMTIGDTIAEPLEIYTKRQLLRMSRVTFGSVSRICWKKSASPAIS
jgi:ABC-type glutathione transport system ATPase component